MSTYVSSVFSIVTLDVYSFWNTILVQLTIIGSILSNAGSASRDRRGPAGALS